MPDAPKGVVLITHGYAEHCGRYREVAHVITNAGWAALSYDVRGHGQSPGDRGYIDRFDVYLDDFAAVLAAARALVPAGAKTVALGHSHGGSDHAARALRRPPARGHARDHLLPVPRPQEAGPRMEEGARARDEPDRSALQGEESHRGGRSRLTTSKSRRSTTPTSSTSTSPRHGGSPSRARRNTSSQRTRIGSGSRRRGSSEEPIHSPIRCRAATSQAAHRALIFTTSPGCVTRCSTRRSARRCSHM